MENTPRIDSGTIWNEKDTKWFHCVADLSRSLGHTGAGRREGGGGEEARHIPLDFRRKLKFIR
jgi:hypothetical protein